jgi:DNA-binding response OmpR family regulator
MCDHVSIAGARVLLIEEELMISMLVEDMLDELGCVLAAKGATLEEAMALAAKAEFDVAILDVMVNGRMIFPVAEILVERKLPFIFSTALVPQDIPWHLRDRPLLRKPFQCEELAGMLREALAASRAEL